MIMEDLKNSLVKTHELLKEIQVVSDEYGLQSLGKPLRSVRNFAEQNSYLDVAVLGQFKAGKSSFLNSLLGRSILPVGSIPVTSVITRIRFGPRETAAVMYLDNVCEEIPLDAVQSYVSESENPENHRNVLSVDIEAPILDHLQSIRLVDTPGIGSVWRHNTETTTGWFPETGGALMVISAERPISESELSLMQEIYKYTPEIAVVITKVDLFSEEQIQEIESFTAAVIKKNFDREFPVFRYSMVLDYDKYNQQIEQRFLIPLVENREETYVRILRHKVTALADHCISYLEIAHQASLKAESDKAKLKEIILDEHLNSHYVRRELLLIINGYKEKTREKYRIYLDTYQKDILEKLMRGYEEAFSGWKGNLYQVTRQFEKWLRESLGAELKEILLTEEKSFELLSAVKKHLAFDLKSFRERLGDNLSRALGVEMKAEEWEIIVGDFKKPDISISRSFDSHLDLLWFMFPMFIFRNVFKRAYASQIPYEVEKNIHRLTSGLTEKTNKEMDRLMSQALSYMNEELKTVEQLISENKEGSEEILQCMNRIRDRLTAF